MKESWEKAIQFVLKWEGGLSNDKDDPGGLTIYGICARSYPNDVQKMYELWKANKKEEAKKIAIDIYKKNYWDKSGCDNLPYPLDIIVFDTAVNMGVGTAQGILKASQKDPLLYILLRIKRYRDIALANPKSAKFFLGWINRVVDLFTFIKGAGK